VGPCEADAGHHQPRPGRCCGRPRDSRVLFSPFLPAQHPTPWLSTGARQRLCTPLCLRSACNWYVLEEHHGASLVGAWPVDCSLTPSGGPWQVGNSSVAVSAPPPLPQFEILEDVAGGGDVADGESMIDVRRGLWVLAAS
jgi:hypothetical protein